MTKELIKTNEYQRFSVQTLWHFTGYGKNDEKSAEILCQIIQSKILITNKTPQQILIKNQERHVLGHSCLCDIPFKDLKIHTKRYGKFGIAFKRNSAIENGHFNPMLYAHRDHKLLDYISNMLTQKLDPQMNHDEDLNEFYGLLGTYLKIGDLTSENLICSQEDDEAQNNNFYFEREWRSIAPWNFKPEDVEAVMVPKKYIPEFSKLLSKAEIHTSLITYESLENL